MHAATFLADIVPALALASTLILGLGIALLSVAREPARRQRIGELTVGAVLLWLALTMLPIHRDVGRWFWKDRVAVEAPVTMLDSRDVLVSADDMFDDIADETSLAEIPYELPVESASAIEPIAPSADGSWDRQAPPVGGRLRDYAAMAYLIGVLLVTGYCLICKVALYRALRRTKDAPQWLTELYSSILVNRPADVLVSQRDTRPFSCGVLRPRIVLPSAIYESDNKEATRHVLLHEQAHVERFDACGHALFNLALPILYAHPLYWLLRWKTQFARELVADAWATQRTDKLSYVEDLTQIVRWGVSRWLSPIGIMGVSHFRSPFCRRMNLLMERDTSFSTTISRFWMCASLVMAVTTSIAVATAIGLPAVANADDIPTEQAETEEADSEQVSAVKTVDLPPLPASEPIDCVVKANVVTLRARVDGMIESTFREGQVVKKNDVVASLDTTHAEIQVRYAEQKYAASRVHAENDVDVRYATVQEEAADAQLSGAIAAIKRAPGSLSESEVRYRRLQVDRAKLAVEQAQRDLKSNRIGLGESEAELMAVKRMLEEYKVRSPIDGVVTDAYVGDGESVDRGDPICKIQQMDQLRIVAFVPFEEYRPEQLPNRQVVIQGRRGGNRFVVGGKVSSVGSSVDGAGRIKVTVDVVNQRTNGSWLLLPGMGAILQFTATKAAKADVGSNDETTADAIEKVSESVDNATRAQPEAEAEESLAELIASLSRMQQRIKALNDAQARGGETQQLAEVECELAIAKARLASAKGDEDEARKQYETAAEVAERLVQAQEAAYETGTITLDRLLRGYRTRAETKAWLKRVK